MQQNIKLKISDEKNRIILSIIEHENKDRWIFHRYKDMSEEKKQLLKKLYIMLKEKDDNAMVLEEGTRRPITDLDNFLNFKDNVNEDLCG